MKNKRYYMFAKVLLPNGKIKEVLISSVLRHALIYEKKTLHNKYWFKTLTGKYLTISVLHYYLGHTLLTVGKVLFVGFKPLNELQKHKMTYSRNQFVTSKALKDGTAFHYLKHNYSWYNKVRIWLAVSMWTKTINTKNKKGFIKK